MDSYSVCTFGQRWKKIPHIFVSLYTPICIKAHAQMRVPMVIFNPSNWRFYRRSCELCVTDKEKKPSSGASIGVSANSLQLMKWGSRKVAHPSVFDRTRCNWRWEDIRSFTWWGIPKKNSLLLFWIQVWSLRKKICTCTSRAIKTTLRTFFSDTETAFEIIPTNIDPKCCET